jgi:DNA-binding HxlR family transcriptional regulator
MTTYGQFCPVAKAMELLDERWTLLVVRELLSGSTHFNELRRGNPKMSPALLSKRLQTLERAGVVRRETEKGRSSYHLTTSGEELRPIVDALGAWGMRWIGELGDQDLDPHLLFWDIRRTVPVERWPRGRTVLEFVLDDVAPAVRHWWLVVDGAEVDVCDVDPGHEVAVRVHVGLRTLVRVWRGDRSWAQAVRADEIVLNGPRSLVDQVPGWVGQMRLAVVPRPRRSGVPA